MSLSNGPDGNVMSPGESYHCPGLWLQKLTTREPDDSQLEVAICAPEGAMQKEGMLLLK